MSRRIASLAIAAIGAVVLASPTYADRECFGGSCPEVADPPAELAAPPNAPAALPRVIEPQAAAPAAAVPPVIEMPALRPAPPAAVASPQPAPVPAIAPARPSQRFAIDEDQRLSRPIRSTSRTIEPLPTLELQMRAVASAVAPAYVVQQAPPSAGIMIVGAPTLYGDDGVLPAHPNMYPDPAWKLCQVDRSPQGRRYYHCGPYSYHPYGSNGYRPLGTYRAYRAAPAYVYAPSARIIAVEGVD